MFPDSYFGPRYFPQAYWPRPIAGPAVGLPEKVFLPLERSGSFAARLRGKVFPAAVRASIFTAVRFDNVFTPAPRGGTFDLEE